MTKKVLYLYFVKEINYKKFDMVIRIERINDSGESRVFETWVDKMTIKLNTPPVLDKKIQNLINEIENQLPDLLIKYVNE